MANEGTITPDIIVIGGGPAGLLIARSLAPRLRVVLLEKRRIGETQKFWLTIRERLERHGLQHCITYSAPRVTAGTFLGELAPTYGDFCTVDEGLLLTTLAQQCTELGVCVKENAEVLSIAWRTNGVKVISSNGSYRARLIIDASGSVSPVASTFRLHKLRGFFSVYGAHIKGIHLNSTDIIGAHVIRLGHPPPIIEVIPTGLDSAFCIIFVAAKSIVDPTSLSAQFHSHVANNPFFTACDLQIINEKMGAIPIGWLRSRQLPGVMPFGEAAMVQAPLLGAAFNEVLEYLEFAAAAVTEAFHNPKPGPINVQVKYPFRKSVNDYLQMLLVKQILDGNIEKVEALVKFLGALGSDRSYRLYSGHLGFRDSVALTYAFLKSFLQIGKSGLNRSQVASNEISDDFTRN